ncbi:MAG: glycosyltransferase [Cytophagaceae bacterium]|nr:glycosyltransferase [Cytophagaceae bacterium]
MAILLLLFGCFALAVGIQLIFILFVFTKTASYRIVDTSDKGFTPGISIVVCAWDELENLRELLPMLLEQQYPDFEVIIVDDRSTDGTYDYLLEACQSNINLRHVHVEQTPAHITSKKYALTLGIRAAKKDVILVTDADCRPSSLGWVSTMVGQLSEDKDLVLGFSPYQRRSGLLNAFVRFETFYTALQYFSLALVRIPYMGVGRNLMYRRTLFLENKGFNGHLDVMGGDDDLFVNRVATAQNTAICLDPVSFVWSLPKTTWQTWYRQKRRHLSVGRHYLPRFRRILGLLALSQLFTWLLFVGLLITFVGLREWLWAGLTAGLFLIRLVALWIVYAAANRRLGRLINAWALPFYDGVLSLYHAWMGGLTVFSRKKLKWR